MLDLLQDVSEPKPFFWNAKKVETCSNSQYLVATGYQDISPAKILPAKRLYGTLGPA